MLKPITYPYLEIKDYQVRYNDQLDTGIEINEQRVNYLQGDKVIHVKVTYNFRVAINWVDPLLTVGWLLSEVNRKYDELLDTHQSADYWYRKRLIVGLKTYEFNPTLDYYLTQLDNPISPIMHNTVLRVHFSKIGSIGKSIPHSFKTLSPKKASRNIRATITKHDFEYICVIGKGGYSKVVLARK